MGRRKQSRGTCSHCGLEIAKSGVGKHLAACARLKESVTRSEEKKGRAEPQYHLRIQAAGLPEFWLDLEMRGSATLKHLDHYLRAIWLECCGHMSEFSSGVWLDDVISMKRRVEEVFGLGTQVTHTYDFGTTSETLIKAVGLRQGKPLTGHPITLLVRNVMPAWECIECQKPASWLCHECLIEEEVWGALCDEHAGSHPHRDYGEPVRLVNSPRLGLCGYDGPAEPPY